MRIVATSVVHVYVHRAGLERYVLRCAQITSLVKVVRRIACVRTEHTAIMWMVAAIAVLGGRVISAMKYVNKGHTE